MAISARTRRGGQGDTRGNTQADEDTYTLIMRDKECLLDPAEPLRFTFSHTALWEGWDNPNVFQVYTPREAGSELECHQQSRRHHFETIWTLIRLLGDQTLFAFYIRIGSTTQNGLP